MISPFLPRLSSLVLVIVYLWKFALSAGPSSPCANSCSGHGLCNTHARVCSCFAGYEGGDCSLKSCPKGPAWTDQPTAVDDAHNLAVCSNKGICDFNLGLCACQNGFEGNACQRKTCPNDCNNAGKCLSMSQYALTKDPGSGVVYSYENNWDAHMLYGCNCDEGYYGPDCTLRHCPTGDDPLTTGQVNEVQGVTCKASGGYFTLSFQGHTTRNIPFNARIDAEALTPTSTPVRTPGSLQSIIEALPNVGPRGVFITSSSVVACSEVGINGVAWTVEFLQNFGNVPLLVPRTKHLTSSIVTPIVVTEVTPGTKENVECSNRGVCDNTVGVCTCSNNFDTSNGYNLPGQRGDCGYATTTIQFCPGLITCSGHGVGIGQCPGRPTYKCQCVAGWTGADCSLRTCPTGVSWFTYPSNTDEAHLYEEVECSNMGACDQTSGLCLCALGFTGAACELMVCPGDIIPCNGYGQCLDMNTLAALTTINGDLARFTYGATPNTLNTWDAFKVRGCLCDNKHTGYDCSLLQCEIGDNPVTTHQADEKQIISCQNDSPGGQMILSFRESVSAVIPGTASTAQVQQILSAVPTMGKIKVELFDPKNKQDVICTASGNLLIVTFLTVHGDLPFIKVVKTTGITSDVIITEYQKGTKENLICSGQGLCDNANGVCNCFQGFGDSDGMGGKGDINDCGYYEEFVPLLIQ